MINNTQLKQIAYLAKLAVDNNALDATAQDLNNILTLAGQLSEINTSDVTPMAHPFHMSQRLRVDAINDQDRSNIFQSIAPQASEQYYLVPTVIE